MALGQAFSISISEIHTTFMAPASDPFIALCHGSCEKSEAFLFHQQLTSFFT